MKCVYCGEMIARRKVIRSVIGDREVLVRWAFCPLCDDAAVDGYVIMAIGNDVEERNRPLQLRRAGR